jgi:hypothetical protein
MSPSSVTSFVIPIVPSTIVVIVDGDILYGNLGSILGFNVTGLGSIFVEECDLLALEYWYHYLLTSWYRDRCVSLCYMLVSSMLAIMLFCCRCRM